MTNPIFKEDLKIIGGAAFIFILSLFGLLSAIDYFSIIAAWISVITVDIYFIYVVFYAARRSDVAKDKNKKWNWEYWIPNKFSGVIVFGLLYFSVIISFAKIMQPTENGYPQNAAFYDFYQSFISITAFNYELVKDKSDSVQQFLQLFQSFNGILLLTATFGFLISRISNFKEEITLESIHSEIKKNNLSSGKRNNVANKRLGSDIKELKRDIHELKTILEELKNRIDK